MGVQEPGCAGTQAGFAKHVHKPSAHTGDPFMSPKDNEDEKKIALRQETQFALQLCSLVVGPF